MGQPHASSPAATHCKPRLSPAAKAQTVFAQSAYFSKLFIAVFISPDNSSMFQALRQHLRPAPWAPNPSGEICSTTSASARALPRPEGHRGATARPWPGVPKPTPAPELVAIKQAF